MKLICCLLLALFSITTLSAQPFEGEIIYKNSYKSKMPAVSDEQFTVMMGSQQLYYIKNRDYKSVADGTTLQWQLYVQADNKLYTKVANSEAVLWIDAGINTDSLIKADSKKEVLDVLGYTCDELVLTVKSGTIKFYYNSKIPADAQLFAAHKFGFWSELMAKANAVPLKFIIETPQFILESVAISIKPMVLEKNMFALPAGVKLIKSPY